MSTSTVKINELAPYINDWANKNFPDRTTGDVVLKAYEEIGEFMKNPSDPHELADVFILFLDLAVMHNIDIGYAILQKMDINHNRKWQVDPDTRIMRHIE